MENKLKRFNNRQMKFRRMSLREAAVTNGIRKAPGYIYMGLLCLFALGYGWFILTYSSKEHGPRTPTRRQRKVEAALRLLSPYPHFLFSLASQPMVTLTFMLRLPSSVKSLWRHHHRYSQRYLPPFYHILFLNPTITGLSPTSLTPKHITLP